MTSRERWTVYPLLFLSLGMGLRSRLTGVVDATTVHCETLTIAGRNGTTTARLGSTPGNHGQIEFFGADGKPVLIAGTSADGRSGQVIIQNAKGKPQVGLFLPLVPQPAPTKPAVTEPEPKDTPPAPAEEESKAPETP